MFIVSPKSSFLECIYGKAIEQRYICMYILKILFIGSS